MKQAFTDCFTVVSEIDVNWSFIITQRSKRSYEALTVRFLVLAQVVRRRLLEASHTTVSIPLFARSVIVTGGAASLRMCAASVRTAPAVVTSVRQLSYTSNPLVMRWN